MIVVASLGKRVNPTWCILMPKMHRRRPRNLVYVDLVLDDLSLHGIDDRTMLSTCSSRTGSSGPILKTPLRQ